MSDKRGTMSAGHARIPGLVETMRMTDGGERKVTLGFGGDELRRVGR
jgi:hypothetical protein